MNFHQFRDFFLSDRAKLFGYATHGSLFQRTTRDMWVYWRQSSHNLSAVCATIWQAEKTFARHARFPCIPCSYSPKAIPRGKWTDERRYPFEARKLTKNPIPVYEAKPITTLNHSLNPRTPRNRMPLSTRDFTTVEFRHVARFLKKQYKRSYRCFAEWITSFPLWPAAMGVV